MIAQSLRLLRVPLVLPILTSVSYTHLKVSDLSSWNEYKNKKHYLEYQTYQKEHQDYSKKEVIKYIDTFYQDYYQDLKDLKYSYKQVLSLMKVAELSDFKVIVDNKYTYSQIKSYLKINGMEMCIRDSK